MNFYQLLGVNRNATPEEIAKAYRKKASTLHPDVNNSPKAVEEFKQVNEAYKTLSDPSKRAIYNSKNPDVVVPSKTGRKPKKEPISRNDPNFGKSTIIDVPQKNVDIWENIKQEMDSWEQKTSQPKKQVWEDWEWKADQEKPKPKSKPFKWNSFAEEVFSKSKDPNLGKHTIVDVPEKKNDLNSRKEEHFKDSVKYTSEDSPDIR